GAAVLLKEWKFDIRNKTARQRPMTPAMESSVQPAEQPPPGAPAVATGATVTAVDRVLDILEAFNRIQKPLSLTDLAEATGIPKSSCHAIVGTLIARGYLYTLSRPRALYPTRR